jgi:putative DNA primase/helicase
VTRPTLPRASYLMTDVGNAQRLVATHGHDLRWVPRWKTWMVWDGRRWARDESGEVERRAKMVTRDMLLEAADLEGEKRQALVQHALKSEQSSRIKAMVDLARTEPGVSLPYDALDQQPMLLTVANGTLDLRTGKLGPFDRAHLMSKAVDITYDPEAACPVWEQTLSVIFAGDQPLIDYIQRAIGYSLTGDTTEQCLHVCHGTGSNGKSTLLDVLEQLTGEYGRQADSSTFLDRRHDSGPRNDVARLAGARLVRSSEVGEGKRFNEQLVKSLTGGDTITARFLFSEDFEYRPQFKLWFAANAKPVIRGTDYAIWRRIRLVPFTVTITPEQRDDNLPAKLRAELPGILKWAVDGCQDWLAEGLRPPEIVLAATAEYRSESDIIATFIADCCEVNRPYEVPAGTLYTAYKRWATDNGEFVLSNTKFGREMAERGFETRKTMGINVRTGIRLAHEASPDFFGGRRTAA